MALAVMTQVSRFSAAGAGCRAQNGLEKSPPPQMWHFGLIIFLNQWMKTGKGTLITIQLCSFPRLFDDCFGTTWHFPQISETRT